MASIHTKVIWSRPLNLGAIALAKEKFASMADRESEPSTSEFSLSGNEVTIHRYWADLDSATEWVNYITTLNPVLVTIVE